MLSRNPIGGQGRAFNRTVRKNGLAQMKLTKDRVTENQAGEANM